MVALADVSTIGSSGDQTNPTAAQRVSASSPHDEIGPELSTEGGQPAEELPEDLPGRAWVTLIAFAAFVVMASGCMFTFVFR